MGVKVVRPFKPHSSQQGQQDTTCERRHLSKYGGQLELLVMDPVVLGFGAVGARRLAIDIL